MKYIISIIVTLMALSPGRSYAADRVIPMCVMEDDLKFEDKYFEILDIPSHVKDILPKIIDKLWSEILWDKGSDLESDILPTLQRFRISRKYYLWVYGISIPSANIRRIYLVLENSRAKIVMEKIHSLDFRWTTNVDNPYKWNKDYIKGKLIEIKDVDDDGENEIVIQQRVHNGTRENAARYNFYKVVDDELENIFNYYAREITQADTFIIRNAKFINKGKRSKFVDMGVYHKAGHDEPSLIGSVKFTISDDKKRYVRTSEQLYDKKFEKDALYRGSDVN